MFVLNDDIATPPLPPLLTIPEPDAKQLPVSFQRTGCWQMELRPNFADDFDPRFAEFPILKSWTLQYQGTLRVEVPTLEEQSHIPAALQVKAGLQLRISGDLYVQRAAWDRAGAVDPPAMAGPTGRSVPVYRRQDYTYYLTVQGLTVGPEDAIVLEMAVSRYKSKDSTWGAAETLTATLTAPAAGVPESFVPDPPGSPKYFSGPLRNKVGAQQTQVGTLTIGRVSKFLREISIVGATAQGVPFPLDNGQGLTIEAAFAQVDWLAKVAAPMSIQGPASYWENSDLIDAMWALRKDADFDTEWLYHALIVTQVKSASDNGFGRTYDDSLDSDLVPREGLIVAAQARFPATAGFGTARNSELQDERGAFFFTLMHELGHVMGLLHRFRKPGYMQGVNTFALLEKNGQTFPDNLVYYYDWLDRLRLRHHPDIFVRSGGAPYGTGYAPLPVPDVDAFTDVGAQLELDVKPVDEVIPLGAPVCLQVRMTNLDEKTLNCPNEISITSGSVNCRVVGPPGEVHAFSSAAPEDSPETGCLAPGRALYHGETIWRGPKGPLFPSPGTYRIELAAEWVAPGGVARSVASCAVMIAAPRGYRHAKVACRLLACSDVGPLQVFQPAPHLADPKAQHRMSRALRLLHDALSVEELAPSIRPIEARRLAPFALAEAARLVTADDLMTTSDIEALLSAVEGATPAERVSEPVRRMLEVCEKKLRHSVREGWAPHTLLDRATGLYL